MHTPWLTDFPPLHGLYWKSDYNEYDEFIIHKSGPANECANHNWTPLCRSRLLILNCAPFTTGMRLCMRIQAHTHTRTLPQWATNWENWKKERRKEKKRLQQHTKSLLVVSIMIRWKPKSSIWIELNWIIENESEFAIHIKQYMILNDNCEAPIRVFNKVNLLKFIRFWKGCSACRARSIYIYISVQFSCCLHHSSSPKCLSWISSPLKFSNRAKSMWLLFKIHFIRRIL